MAGVAFAAVTKRFGDVLAVDELTFAADDQDFLVLLGPSGCGKSTALRMVAGLEEPSEGEIHIGDRVVNGLEPKERDIAMVFQSYALYPHKSVRENIEFPLKPRGVPKEERHRMAGEVAAQLGLGELLDRKPRELSGGQRQRVALARAIVRRPAVFLMDEPLSNLDAKMRTQTRADLVELQKRLGTTFLYVTHDQVEAMTMAKRVAVMNAGALQQVGPPQEVYDRPANTFVARFIGSPPMNTLTAHVVDEDGHRLVRTAAGAFPLPEPLSGEVGRRGLTDIVIGVRPEHLAVATGDIPGLDAHVRLVESLGYERLLVCDAAGGEPVIVRVDADDPVPAEGETVRLTTDPARLHVFDPATTLRVDGGD